MSAMVWNGLTAMVADARMMIAQLGSQARQYLTRADVVHGFLIVVGMWLADGLVDDPLLVWLDNGLVLGVVLGAFPRGVQFAFSTRTAERWRISQRFVETIARLYVVRIGVGLGGPAVLEMIRTMPLESLTLAVAFGLVWLVVWPKRGCQCHTD